MTELTDSGHDAGAPAAEPEEEFVDLAADLDEDLSAEPPPPAPDNRAEPSPSPAAPANGQRPIPNLDQLDPNQASEREKHLLADYTRKTQGIADTRRSQEDQQRRMDQLESRLNSQLAPAHTDDPLAPLRATLNEDEERALDVIQELNKRTLGSQLDQIQQRSGQMETVVKALATHILHSRTEAANSQAAEARELYPDIDAYQEQVSALTAVTNPATTQPYTPSEAYRLIRGIAAERSAQLSASDATVRRGAAATTTPASAVPATPAGGELTTGEVVDGLKQLGFD